MEERKKRWKVVIIILSVLLVLSLAALAATRIYSYLSDTQPVTVMVPDNIITPDPANPPETQASTEGVGGGTAASSSQTAGPESTAPGSSGSTASKEAAALVISLFDKYAGENQPFQVRDMFPGDTQTRYFCVRISHTGDAVVRYHADIRDGYEKLAEVLMIQIRLPATGETLYDGLMRDMPSSLNYTLKADESTVDELYYEITAYLDTSVGNEYQFQQLAADFHWWVEETGSLGPNPQTGELSPVWLYISAAGLSLLLLILLSKKRRKEDRNGQQ